MNTFLWAITFFISKGYIPEKTMHLSMADRGFQSRNPSPTLGFGADRHSTAILLHKIMNLPEFETEEFTKTFSFFQKFSCLFAKCFVIIETIIRTSGSSFIGGFKKIKTSAILLIIFSVLLLAIPSFVSAEQVLYQSALVWRSDGKGDYLLPAIAQDSTYILNPGIVTNGVIQSITATWKFEGEVDLEVSADNGIHFVPVTNGVPLAKNFSPGTSLKWKAALGPDSRLDEVVLAYTDASGVVAGFHNPALAGFKYRKTFFVKGSENGTLYNFQLKILVGEGQGVKDVDLDLNEHISADFKDVRFTLSDGETVLAHTLERITGNDPNRVAEFYVKVPQIPTNGIMLCLTYGNPDAKDASDPKATFDFYENFDGTALDPQKWVRRVSLVGVVDATKNGLLLNDASVLSKAFQFKGGVIEFSATAAPASEIKMIVRDPDPTSEADASQIVYSSGFEGAQHCIAIGGIVKANEQVAIEADQRYDYRVAVNNTDIIFDRFGSLGRKQATVMFRDTHSPYRGYFGFKNSTKNNAVFHFLRVRKYASVPPEILPDSVGAEEGPFGSFYRNIAMEDSGDLVLDDNSKRGVIFTDTLVAGYPLRILVPTWIGTGVSVDISADGGETYKEKCRNETYYYASRRDFEKGNSLLARIALIPGKSSLDVARLGTLALQYGPGNITVLSPEKGESVALGSQKQIIWSAWEYERGYPMNIELSADGGQKYSTIAGRVSNSGRYLWSVPNDKKLASGHVKVRVSDAYDDSVAGASDFFAIEAR